jgi:hypothetical protein
MVLNIMAPPSRRCNRDAGRQSTSAARFFAGLFGFLILIQ